MRRRPYGVRGARTGRRTRKVGLLLTGAVMVAVGLLVAPQAFAGPVGGFRGGGGGGGGVGADNGGDVGAGGTGDAVGNLGAGDGAIIDDSEGTLDAPAGNGATGGRAVRRR